MRILITGASGFVGRPIAFAADALGHAVTAISRSDPKLPPTCRFFQTDFFDASKRQHVLSTLQADIVIHAAWFVEHGAFWQSSENDRWCDASMRFIDEAKAFGVKRFVGIGTCYEYAWPDNGPCDEFTTPLAVHTPYDAAKARTREYLGSLTDTSGFSSAWARLFLLYGAQEGQNRLGPSVVRSLLRNDVARCGSGRAFRDFLDVRDVAGGVLALALSPAVGAVNIASGEAVTIATFAQLIGEELGLPERVLLGALPDRPGEPPYIVAATERLRNEVGFQPAITLVDGIRALCEDQRSRIFVDIKK